jgi:hypothetical protein
MALAMRMILMGLAITLAMPAMATEPCSPLSWFAKPDRPASEWSGLAKWIVVGTVKAREERMVPYANCYMKDQSRCAMDDRSTVTITVTSVEKGTVAKNAELKLQSDYCAPPPPKEVGKAFRFYGVGPGTFIFFKDRS